MFSPGWPPKDWSPQTDSPPEPPSEVFGYLTLRDFLYTDHASDVMGASYVFPDCHVSEAVGVRLRGDPGYVRAGLLTGTGLPEESYPALLSPRLGFALIDVDLRGHRSKTWVSLMKDKLSGLPEDLLGIEAKRIATQSLESLLAALPNDLRGRLGGYTTRAGLRVVGVFSGGLTIERAPSVLAALVSDVNRAIEESKLSKLLDPSETEVSKSWLRVYRAPSVIRDGGRVSGAVVDPGGYLDWAAYGVARGIDLSGAAETTSIASAVGERLSEGEPALDFSEVFDFGALEDFRDLYPYLTQGRSPAPDSSGSVYPVLCRDMRYFASKTRERDPREVYRFFWPSLRHETPGRRSDLFRFACWITARLEVEGEQEETPEDWREPYPDPEDVPSEVWRDLEGSFLGRASELLRRAQRGEPLARRRDYLVAKSVEFLRTVAQSQHESSPEVLFSLVYRSADQAATKIQGAPTLQEVWVICKEEAEKVYRRLQDSDPWEDEEVRSLWIEQNPLILVSSEGGPPFIRSGKGRYRPSSPAGLFADLKEFALPAMPFSIPVDELSRTGLPALVSAYGRSIVATTFESLRDYPNIGQLVLDPQTGSRSLVISKHLRRTVLPESNTDIETYLRLLFSDSYDLVMDWIAVYCDTDRPVPALIIQGVRGTGKDLFVDGLRGFSGPMEATFEATLSGFPTDLFKSWLVYAGEGITPSAAHSAEETTRKLRKIVTDRVHPINIKHQTATEIRCCYRLVVSMNSEGEVDFGAITGQASLDAIVERLLYARADPRAREWLFELKRKYKTSDLKDVLIGTPESPGTLVRHIAHIIATRRAKILEYDGRKGDNRLTVATNNTEWHRRLLRRQRRNALLSEAIIASARRAPGANNVRRVLLTGEKVAITAETARDNWPQDAGRVPPIATLRAMLRDESGGSEKVRIRINPSGPSEPRNVYCIPWETLIDSDVIDREDLREIARNETEEERTKEKPR